MSVEKYPIDFDTLTKGSWLETDVLVKCLGVNPADGDPWRFALRKFRDQIESTTGIVCFESHDRLRLATDEEADEYVYRQFGLHHSGITRQARRRLLIDRNAMDDDRRRLTESRDRIVFGVAAAARKELRRQRKLEKIGYKPTLEISE